MSGFSLEGGQLIAYLDGPAVVKLVVTHYGEMGRTSEEYYYSNGKLIFVFAKVSHYNKPMSGKVVRTVENRYYFDNDQMIRWIVETETRQTRLARNFDRNRKTSWKTQTGLSLGLVRKILSWNNDVAEKRDHESHEPTQIILV